MCHVRTGLSIGEQGQSKGHTLLICTILHAFPFDGLPFDLLNVWHWYLVMVLVVTYVERVSFNFFLLHLIM